MAGRGGLAAGGHLGVVGWPPEYRSWWLGAGPADPDLVWVTRWSQRAGCTDWRWTSEWWWNVLGSVSEPVLARGSVASWAS